MNSTARSMRLQIAVFGRTNVGKSSLVNFLTGQDIAITSPVPGTTTDTVEKAMEFAPVGAVLFIDTAGLDDTSTLGCERIKRTSKIFDRADIAVLVTTPGIFTEVEKSIVSQAQKHNLKLIITVNQCDTQEPTEEFINQLRQYNAPIICTSCSSGNREKFVSDFRNALLKSLPESFLQPPPLLGDLIQTGDLVVMVVPIDLQAPKGRLILPQVQAIRDALDHQAMILTLKEEQFAKVIKELHPQPALIICDSQVVKEVTANTPQGIPCTTFSILFSRLKGDTTVFMQGCNAIGQLQAGDRILIAEACTHHPTCEDIGRVKLPGMLRKATGKELIFDFAPGRDYPEQIEQYKLIIHCGSCMLNRQETLWRIKQAQAANIPITNYGMAISWCQGVLEKVLVPR